jgi:hypothetical protein
MRIQIRRIAGVAAVAVAVLCSISSAVAPLVREEVNLAGTWAQGGTVPLVQANRSPFTTKTFQRTFTLPTTWAGKRIFLELETVNYSPITSIDGVEIGRITGGWLPHSYDVTDKATLGQTHTLTIVASGTCPANWACSYPGTNHSGIIHDVSFRAYGMVAIRDAEIVTSVANKTITVYYDVQNFNTGAHTVTVTVIAVQSSGGTAALTFATPATFFAAGERKTIQVSSPWTNPDLWTPYDPKLYLLCSAVKESGATIDSQTIRFGFREVTRTGRFIRLNGVRMNDRGESIDPELIPDIRATIALEKSVNASGTRFHVNPPPSAMIDECDELGLMVEPEAPLWQAGTATVNNADLRTIWYPAWVKHTRNHASVVWWSVANETWQPLVQLYKAIRENDHSNRPVWNEGGGMSIYFQDTLQITDHLNIFCDHYQGGFAIGSLPTPGRVYSVNGPYNMPYGMGEQGACCGSWGSPEPAVYYWQGIFARGERYQDVSFAPIVEIHTFKYDGWTKNAANAVAKTVLANSYAAVALFDHNYVNLGIAPYQSNTYPSIAAGSTASRALDLYNDEFSDSVVTVKVDIKSGNTTYATGTQQYNVTLGFHIRVTISFQVPYIGGSTMNMVLTTSKAGVQKFSEPLGFSVTGASSGTSSSTVTFTGGASEMGKNATVNLNHAPCTLIFGKKVLVLPITVAGNTDNAVVSIFGMHGECLCRAPVVPDRGGAMAAVFEGDVPAGNYIAKVNMTGRESSARFCLAR